MSMGLRDTLHQMIEALPDSELEMATRFLEYLGWRGEHPVVRAFRDAPEDDEPTTDEDLEAIKANDRAAGKTNPNPAIPHGEFKRRMLADED